MNPLKSLAVLYSHPYNRRRPLDALYRYGRWHARKRLAEPWSAPLWEGRRAIFWPDSLESKWLAYNHVMDWSEFLLMKRFLRAEDVVLDVGANIGIYTLWASTCVGRRGRIVAFEPDPENYARLQRQLALNRLDWVETEEIALASSDGTGRLSQGRDMENHLAPSSEPAGAGDQFIRVRTRTLDSYLRDRGIGKVSFLKLDVEGAELQILGGAAATLSSRSIALIQFEANDQARQYGHRSQDVIDELGRHGYQTYSYAPAANRLEIVPPERLDAGSHQNLFAAADPAFVFDRLRSRDGHETVAAAS